MYEQIARTPLMSELCQSCFIIPSAVKPLQGHTASATHLSKERKLSFALKIERSALQPIQACGLDAPLAHQDSFPAGAAAKKANPNINSSLKDVANVFLPPPLCDVVVSQFDATICSPLVHHSFTTLTIHHLQAISRFLLRLKI